MKKLIPMIVCSLLLVISSFAQELLDNAKIVEMNKLGFSPAMIVSKIRASDGKYDTSIEAISALKKAGIAEEVIIAMMEATSKSTSTNSSHATTLGGTTMYSTSNRKLGIFWAKGEGKDPELVEIEPTVFRKAKTGGLFGSAMTYGIKKIKTRAVFPGASSAVQIAQDQPVFIFRTNESPKNYSLVQLEQKEKDRRIVVAEGNVFSYESGITNSAIREFNVVKIEDGVYRVTPKAPLGNGEYAIFFGADDTRAYDFSIRVIP